MPSLGIGEQNANLLTAGSTPLEAQRAYLAALHPRYIRVLVDWSKLQPDPGRPARFDMPQAGCARNVGPCAAYGGLRATLAAIHSHDWTPVLVIYGVPAWAAQPPAGCGRPAGAQARSRPIVPAALAAYGQLIRGLQELGRSIGVALPWWAPWNEPDHDYFISPQRAQCDVASPALSPGVYARFVQMMSRLLAPGQSMLLGELASYVQPQPRAASIAEFVAALPDDVICASQTWALHTYALDDSGLRELEGALDARGTCGRQARIWITETGAPAPDARGAGGGSGACGRIAAALNDWSRDPRVDAVFQYEFREDPDFRTGLASASLGSLNPAYGAWLSWTRSGTARC